jgi:integrase
VKGNLTRRGQRSWRLKFDAGSDPTTGRRITKYVTLHGTRRQAQEEGAKIVAAAVSGQHVDPSRETVGAFIEHWLTDWANNNVSNKTWTRYAQLLRKHLGARLGSIPIQKLRAADLQAIYAAMAEEGLADQTRLHLHRVVHRMLGHAEQWGVVVRNVAEMIDAPRVRAHEIEVLTPTEVQTVLETLRGHPLYSVAAVLLGTGLRRGELLALRWQDLNLDGGALQVEQAIEQTTRGGLVFKAPKTKRSRRRVTLPPSIITLLREHWKTQQEQRLILGLGKAPAEGLVFANWDGSVRSPHTLTQQWRKAMKRAGLKITLHSLRHTHASTLIASGLDVLTISRRLGHATPVLTLGTYGHLFKTDDRAATIIEKMLGDGLVSP